MRIPALFVFLFLLATNRYFSVHSDSAVISEAAGDVWIYRTIAEAAPRLPEVQLPHHNAQRFALPYAVGLVARVLHMPVEWSMRAVFLLMLGAAVFLTDRFAARLGFGAAARFGLTALVFWNPYLARIGLAFPFMGNDLGFVLGSILALAGLYRGSVSHLLIGSLLAILCRQTAVVLVFPFFLFAAISFRSRIGGRGERLAVLACAALVVAGYFVTDRVAASLSPRSYNVSTLTSLFTWWSRSFDLGELAAFFARGLAAFAVAVSGFFFAAATLMLSRAPRSAAFSDRAGLCALVFFLAAFLIILQPILGGPMYGNLPRLSSLGLWPLLFGAAIWLRPSEAFSSAFRIPWPAALFLGAVLALHSFHHLLSWPGRWMLNADPRWFFVLQLVLSAVLLTGAIGRPGFARNLRRLIFPK